MTDLRRSATTQALMDIEDAAPALLGERLPGSSVPFWMQVRMKFATLLSEAELGDATIPARMNYARELWRLARSFVSDRSDAAGWLGQRDLVFMVGGTTLHRRDDRARNWLVGAYAEALPGRCLVVQRSALRSDLGRPAFEPTRALDPMFARADRSVALSRWRHSPSDARVRELVAGFAKLLGVEGDPRLPAITTSAAWTERTRPHLVGEFTRFLDLVRPRVLLIEDASYGNYYAPLIALARSRGVVVAEPQHGWIGPAHAAYNYGATMHRPEHSIALPDVLLTFGDQWGEGLRYPGAIVPIGKPHLEERAADAPDPAGRSREVLVVSSVAAADVTMQFVRGLQRALPGGWSVRFRPHPSERAVLATRYPGFFETPGIVLDERPDVYDSLADCQVVIGVASTVLFEAAALGCRVFVRDSPYVPYVIGDLFGEPLSGKAGIDRVVRAVSEGSSTREGRPKVDVTRLWRPNAVANFEQWFEHELSHSL